MYIVTEQMNLIVEVINERRSMTSSMQITRGRHMARYCARAKLGDVTNWPHVGVYIFQQQ